LQVQWRRDKAGLKRKVSALVEKANREFDGHVKIPHPDTDPEERAKFLERMKELNKPMDLYDEYEDFAEDDDYEDVDDGDEGSFGSDGDGDSDDEDRGSDNDSD